MKRKLKYLILLLLITFIGISNVNAKHLDYDDYVNLDIRKAYIVGDYMFDVYSLNHGSYSPTLEDFARSARSIPVGTDEYVYDIMIIKDPDTGVVTTFTMTDILTGETITNPEDFPGLDLKYIYWHTIRGGVEVTDWRRLDSAASIGFNNLQTTGTGEYFQSAKKDIVFTADNNITSAKYCIADSTMNKCTPNIAINEAGGNSYTWQVTFGSNIYEQYICAEVSTTATTEPIVTCDTARIKVDGITPQITEAFDLSNVEVETNKPMTEVYTATYGVNGGELSFTYDDGTGAKPFANVNELPQGEVTITVTATSASDGSKATITKTFTVAPHPLPDTITITYDFPEGDTGDKGKTYYSRLTRAVTVETNYPISEAKYCIASAECQPNTDIALTGTNATENIDFTQSAKSTQLICVKITTEKGKSETVCDNGFLFDKEDPTATSNQETKTIAIGAQLPVNELFTLDWGFADEDETHYYFYHPTTNAKTELTNLSEISIEEFENKVIRVDVETLKNNGKTATATTNVKVTYDGSTDPVKITYAPVQTTGKPGQNDYKKSATQVATIETMYGVKDAKYCFTTSNNCTPGTSFTNITSGELTQDVTLEFPSAQASQVACITATTINDRDYTECYTIPVLVDSFAPTITPNLSVKNYEYGAQQKHVDYFTVEWSYSGKDTETMYYIDEDTPLDPDYQFPTGTYTIYMKAVGKNGLFDQSSMTVVVGEEPITDTVNISWGPVTRYNEGNEYNTKATIQINAEAVIAVTQIQYCFFNADTETGCDPRTSLNSRYETVSASEESIIAEFNTSQTYAQGICARAISSQNLESELICSTPETFKIDTTAPRINVLNTEGTREFVEGTEYTPTDYFVVSLSPISGGTTTYKYFVLDENDEPVAEDEFTTTAILAPGKYKLQANTVGGNGLKDTGVAIITVNETPITPSLQTEFVNLVGVGSNGYYKSASRVIRVTSTHEITKVMYCHSVVSVNCEPNLELANLATGQTQFEELEIPYRKSLYAEHICVKVYTTEPTLNSGGAVCDDEIAITVNDDAPTVQASGLNTTWEQGTSIDVSTLFTINYPLAEGGTAEYYYGDDPTPITNTSNIPVGNQVIRCVATGINGVEAEGTVNVTVTAPPDPDTAEITFDAQYVYPAEDEEYDYKTSASKSFDVTSIYGLQYVKYCIATDEEGCTPNTELSIGETPLTYRGTIEFDSHVSGQKLCVQATTIRGFKVTTCDTSFIKVDKITPIITLTNTTDLTYLKGTSKTPNYLFEIEYGPSGGFNGYFKTEKGSTVPINNLSSIKSDSGTVAVGTSATGNNGKNAMLSRDITVQRITLTYDYTTNGGTIFGGESNVLYVDYNGNAMIAESYTYDSVEFDEETGEPLIARYSAYKEGYDFVGWARTPDSQEVITQQPKITENTTLYAIFKKTYHADFEIYKKDSSMPTAHVDATPDELSCTVYNNETSCDIIVPTLYAYTGHEALGWVETIGEDPVFFGGEVLELTGNKTYYSHTVINNPMTATFYRITEDCNSPETCVVEEVVKECYKYDGEPSCTIEPPAASAKYAGKNPVGYVINQNNPIVNTDYTLSTTGRIFYAYYENSYNVQFISGLTNPQAMPDIDPVSCKYFVERAGVREEIDTIEIPTPVAETGYTTETGKEWRMDTETDEGLYSAGATYQPTGDATFYSIYKTDVVLTYSRDYYLIDSSGQLSSRQVDDGSIQTVPSSKHVSVYTSSANPSVSNQNFRLEKIRVINGTPSAYYKPGYFLVGYYHPSCDNNKCDPGQTISINSNTTVYPIYISNSVIVTFDAVTNGGDNATSTVFRFTIPIEQTQGFVDFDLYDNPAYSAYKGEGYTFVGWSDDPNCASEYSDGICIKGSTRDLGVRTMSAGQEIVLYAIFKKEIDLSYEILDRRAATLNKASQTIVFWNNETTKTINLASESNSNNKLTVYEQYNFLGWSTVRGATTYDTTTLTTLEYTVGQNEIRRLYSVTRENQPLRGTFRYAEFNSGLNNYTTTLYNDTNNTTQCVKYNGDLSCTIEAPTISATYDNKPIASWTSDKTDPYQDNSFVENGVKKFEITENTNYYATYDSPIVVRYYSGIKENDGTYTKTEDSSSDNNGNGLSSKYIATETGINRTSIRFTTKNIASIPGYTTLGWAAPTYVAGQGQPLYQYLQNDAVTLDTTATELEYYGVYQKDVTLSYAKNHSAEEGLPAKQEGTIVYSSKDLYDNAGYEFELAEKGNLSFQGHDFAGWVKSNEANDPNATIYAEGETIKVAGDTKMYAVWDDVTYTVTYHANGGTLYYTYTENNVEHTDEITVDNHPEGLHVDAGQDPYFEGLMNDTVDLSFTGVRAGYEFLGWTLDEAAAESGEVTPTVTIERALSIGVSNINLYAVYGKKVTAYWNSPTPARFVVSYPTSSCYIYPNYNTCAVTIPTVAISAQDNIYRHDGWSVSGNAPVEVGTADLQSTTNIGENTNYMAIIQSNTEVSATIYYIEAEYDDDDDNPTLLGYNKESNTVSCTPVGGQTTCEVVLPLSLLPYNNERAEFVGFERYCYAKNNVCQRNMTASEYYGTAQLETGETKKLIFIDKNDFNDAAEPLYDISQDITLYARYEEENTITLVQGATPTTTNYTETAIYRTTNSSEDIIPEFVTSTLPNPTYYSGWTQYGWRTTQVSSDTGTILPGTQITYDRDQTYYGVYRKQISIKYTANGSENTPPADQNALIYTTAGAANTTTATFVLNNTYTRRGHRLEKWKNTTTFDQYNPGQSITVNQSYTMQPLWNPVTVTMTYNPNGGQVSPSSKQVTYGQQIGGMSVPYNKTGYTFRNWVLQGTSTIIGESTTSTFDTNFTVVAQWNPITVTVTLDPKSGTVSPNSITATYDQEMSNLPDPIRTGHDFVNWKEKNTNKVVTKTTVSKYTSNVTLEAVWTLKNIRFTFDADGGVVSPTSKNVNYNATINNLPTPTKTGYTFDGWFVEDTDDQVQNGDTNLFEEDVTLVAHWTPKTVSVTLSPNGGTVDPTSIDVTYGDELGELPIPEKTGSDFAGWKVQNTNIFVNEHTVSTFDVNTTLVAVWGTKVTITLDPGDGTVDPTSIEVVSDGPFGELPVAVLAGHTFEGWYDGDDLIEETTISTYTTATTLVAHYEVPTVILTLDPGEDGTVNPLSISATLGQALGNLPTPVRAGYDFAGWKIQNTNTFVDATTISTFENDNTLEAVWGTEVTITLDPGDGTVDPTTIQVVSNGLFGELPEPELTGNTFAGWYEGDNLIEATTISTYTSDTTLVAHWTPTD